MRKLLTIFFLLQATLSFGQIAQKNPYKGIKSIAVPDSLPLSGIKYFSHADLFTSQSYQLDSSGVYTMHYMDDALIIRTDTGVWKINKNKLSLTSSKEKSTFDIIIIGEYYFFIRADERNTFISRVKETEAAAAKAQSIEMKGDMNGMNFLTGEMLHEEFFVADYKR